MFKEKLQTLEQELYKCGICGKGSAYLRVIACQIRGLSHANILIILPPNDVIKTPEQVDDLVVAEIPPHPDSITDPDAEVQEQKRN